MPEVKSATFRNNAAEWGQERFLETHEILFAMERINARIDRTNSDKCWEWPGSKNTSGYGQVGIRRVPRSVHRVMHIAEIGPIPAGMLVLHKCDNRGCCNPGHLFLGTHRDNTADMIGKGRKPIPLVALGESAHAAKLTNSQVVLIRELFSNGHKLRPLGRQFGVSKTQIKRIVTRQSRVSG